jgi:hypothetical protein
MFGIIKYNYAYYFEVYFADRKQRTSTKKSEKSFERYLTFGLGISSGFSKMQSN